MSGHVPDACHVVGIDFSTFHIDLVRLDENHNRADWLRITADANNAWDRTRQLAADLPRGTWWDGTYLTAIEKPMNDQQRVLGRVQGVILAAIPTTIQVWEVRPDEWKQPLGIKLADKPTWHDLPGITTTVGIDWTQDALDALAVALYARDTNHKAVQAALAQ